MKIILKISFSFCIVFSFLSCRKSHLEVDDIYYYNIIPDTTITSVSSYYPFSGIPNPNDSTASIQIDLDNDGINDITLSVSHYYQWQSASNPLSNYFYQSGLNMINSIDSIATLNYYDTQFGVNLTVLNFLHINDAINSNLRYHTSATIKSIVFWGPSYNGPYGDSYVGFKIKRNGNYHYGWILISRSGSNLTIKEFALNRTPNRKILAGQTQ